MFQKVILASASPRRKDLLKGLGLKFRVVPSRVDEKLNPRLKPRSQAEELSYQKAKSVSKKYDNALIIGADTLVVIDDRIIGKPVDFREAKRFLRKLSGKKHTVITGVTLIDTGNRRTVTKSAETDVYFRKLTKDEIDTYVIQEDVTDLAGGYAIQGLASVFIEKIEGDYFNVIGLPLFLLSQELKKFGVKVL